MSSAIHSAEFSGGPVNYYKVEIKRPTSISAPYMAECNDIIEALGLTFAEGEAFKAIWRTGAARTLGKAKRGDEAVYNAEKVAFFGQRMLVIEKAKRDNDSLHEALRVRAVPSAGTFKAVPGDITK